MSVSIICRIVCIGITMLFLWGFTPCLAVDPGVYWGQWMMEGQNIKISMTISENQVRLTINGTPYISSEAEYLYGQSAAVPFFFLSLAEPHPVPGYIEYIHALYLVIGAKGGSWEDADVVLRGFYEFTTVKDDHHGSTESISYPIELHR